MKRSLIPFDFEKELPEMKQNHYKWSLDYKSKTKTGTMGHITFYESSPQSHGNLILLPGLASNTSIEPLMKTVMYWSLKSNFNVYCIDTFLGDFVEKVTKKTAKKNTYKNFTKLLDTGLELVEQQCLGQWSCLISHSLSGSGITDIFNERIKNNQKLRFSAAIMFAPYVSKDWHECLLQFFRKRYNLEHLSEEKTLNHAIGLMSPHTFSMYSKPHYIPILINFYKTLDDNELIPDLMNQWNIPVTFVVGGKDKKSPPETIYNLYKNLNNNNFKIVEFTGSKHSFIDQHKDYSAIIKLIKTQRIKQKHIK